MSETANIIHAVSQVWGEGLELFGGDWPHVRQQLLDKMEYLETHPEEEDAAIDSLLAVFEPYPEAREKLVNMVSASPTLIKGEYKPLPGQQGEIRTSRFKCPDPGCDHTWTRRVVGQRVGKCPHHHLPLIPLPEGS